MVFCVPFCYKQRPSYFAGVVNPGGEACPFALKMLACMLLMEITAFLRETFQYLPRSKVSAPKHQSAAGFDKLASHRRWSVLSSTFCPSQTSGSVQSITNLVECLPGELVAASFCE